MGTFVGQAGWARNLFSEKSGAKNEGFLEVFMVFLAYFVVEGNITALEPAFYIYLH